VLSPLGIQDCFEPYYAGRPASGDQTEEKGIEQRKPHKNAAGFTSADREQLLALRQRLAALIPPSTKS
jgi:hypothetical protein